MSVYNERGEGEGTGAGEEEGQRERKRERKKERKKRGQTQMGCIMNVASPPAPSQILKSWERSMLSPDKAIINCSGSNLLRTLPGSASFLVCSVNQDGAAQHFLEYKKYFLCPNKVLGQTCPGIMHTHLIFSTGHVECRICEVFLIFFIDCFINTCFLLVYSISLFLNFDAHFILKNKINIT